MIKLIMSPGQEIELLEALENMPPGKVEPVPSDVDLCDQYHMRIRKGLEEQIKALEDARDASSVIDTTEPEQPIASFKENSLIEIDHFPGVVWKWIEGQLYRTVGNRLGERLQFCSDTLGRLSHKEIKRET